MSKHSQDRTPRLAIVGPTNPMPEGRPAAARWWGPQRTQSFLPHETEAMIQTRQDAARTLVMPATPRSWTERTMTWMWNCARSYFVQGEQRQSTVVLSFRRYAMKARSRRRMTAAEDFALKKSSGSVGWQSAAPQEGGRR